MSRKYKVIALPEFDQDLTDIHNYITYRLLSPGTADAYTDTIVKAASGLDRFPYWHPKVHFEPWKSRGVRFFTVKKYIIYYSINEQAAVINVMAAVYGGRNQLKVLNGKFGE